MPTDERLERMIELAREAFGEGAAVAGMEGVCAVVLTPAERGGPDIERIAIRHPRAFEMVEASLLIATGETSLRALERASLPRTRESEIVICSAIRLSDGRIFRGHRHHDCLRTAHALIEYLEPGSWEARSHGHDQGFITSRNRYVEREEGLRLQRAAGIESACPSGYRAHHLFSEDLY